MNSLLPRCPVELIWTAQQQPALAAHQAARIPKDNTLFHRFFQQLCDSCAGAVSRVYPLKESPSSAVAKDESKPRSINYSWLMEPLASINWCINCYYEHLLAVIANQPVLMWVSANTIPQTFIGSVVALWNSAGTPLYFRPTITIWWKSWSCGAYFGFSRIRKGGNTLKISSPTSCFSGTLWL